MSDHISQRTPAPVVRACLLAACLFTAGLLAPRAFAADTRFGLDAEITHDANVNRAAYDGDRQTDEMISAEAYAARGFRLSARSGIVLRGSLRLREHREFGDLSQVAALGRTAYRFQPTPGFTSPWVEIAAAAEILSHRDSSLRDGSILSGTLSVGRYLTDRIRAIAGLGVDEREGRDGALYDLSTTRAWLGLDYRVGMKSTLYGNAAWIRGDHVFTASYPNAQNWLSPYADVIAADPAFTGAFGGVPTTAYRLEAKTVALEIGLNVPLTGTRALDIGASWFESEADAGNSSYDGTAVRIGYLVHFR